MPGDSWPPQSISVMIPMRERASPFRHLGGTILADHGPLTLDEAQNLIRFYRAELALFDGGGAQLCRQRAESLEQARAQAILWRRAAGWREPATVDVVYPCRRDAP